MRNPKLYLLSKIIHRYLVLITLTLGLLMIVTGYLMYSGNYFFFDASLIRYFHNKLSILFSTVLGIMMITGVYLFIFPYLPIPQNKNIPDRNGQNQ